MRISKPTCLENCRISFFQSWPTCNVFVPCPEWQAQLSRDKFRPQRICSNPSLTLQCVCTVQLSLQKSARNVYLFKAHSQEKFFRVLKAFWSSGGNASPEFYCPVHQACQGEFYIIEFTLHFTILRTIEHSKIQPHHWRSAVQWPCCIKAVPGMLNWNRTSQKQDVFILLSVREPLLWLVYEVPPKGWCIEGLVPSW